LATSHLAVLEVEGDVGVPLEDAHLAFAFEADAAGGDVGNTAVGKEDAGVGDILLAGEDGAPMASMRSTGEPTMCCMMSISWIIRSSTTLTSCRVA